MTAFGTATEFCGSSAFGLRHLIRHPSFIIRHLNSTTHSPAIVIQRCIMSDLRETFASVRGYGLRAYEPRQGRNAATVV